MRRAAAAATWLVLALAAPAAEARYRRPPPPPPEHTHDFWRDILSPHADEVAAIIAAVDTTLQGFDAAFVAADVTGENRTRALHGAYRRLRFARKLAPDNVDVLGRLARVADALGNTHQAIEALEAALALEKDPDASESTALNGMLGEIYLRTRDLDQAIRYLRLAQGQATAEGAQSTIALATALAMRDQMADAIEVLDTWPGQLGAAMYQTDDPTIAVTFALAVFYDRDDQRGAAFDVLDKMQSNLGQFGQQVQSSLATLRFEPAEDESYFDALLYESQGDYSEARAAWATYAASNGAYRARALEHVAAIDAERKAHPGEHPVPQQQQAPQVGIPYTRGRRRP